MKRPEGQNAAELARAFDRAVRTLATRNTPNLRKVRRDFSKQVKPLAGEEVLELAVLLTEQYGYRWLVYELLRYHVEAFQQLGDEELEFFIEQVDGWGSADAFATILVGPLWLKKNINNRLIQRWTKSPNRWYRRIALASTVALNRRSQSGDGNSAATLKICSLLVKDKDDMVVKAMSWALRELSVGDPTSVREFLHQHDRILSARVKREVNNKLTTGLKNPKQ